MTAARPKQVAKLKAGKKKKVNKWLIIGGVAAVAVIGAVIVRFSSASTIILTKYVPGSWTLTFKNNPQGSAFAGSFKAQPGKSYRTCFVGRTYSSTSKVKIPSISGSWKTYTVGTTSQPYCGYTGKNTGKYASDEGIWAYKVSGENVHITAFSVEQIK